MAGFLIDHPLIRSWRLAWRRRDLLTAGLYLLLISAAGVALLLPLCPRCRHGFVAAQHLRVRPFSCWAALQFVPSMYNFANEGWISDRPLSTAMLDGRQPIPDHVVHTWINHYPTRFITFGAARLAVPYEAKTMHFYFRSRYQGEQVDSHYVARPSGNAVLVRLTEDEVDSAGP